VKGRPLVTFAVVKKALRGRRRFLITSDVLELVQRVLGEDGDAVNMRGLYTNLNQMARRGLLHKEKQNTRAAWLIA